MTKGEQRNLIRKIKSRFSDKELAEISHSIMHQLEQEEVFKKAEVVLLYHSLKDEVHTHDFIEKWYKKKNILLPKVAGKNITLHVYTGKDCLEKSSMNILEPCTAQYTQYSKIDLAIVPGMAFDEENRRLGRGGGFYDRLLSLDEMRHTSKIGIAFSFQKVEQVICEPHDIKMDKVIYSSFPSEQVCSK